MTTNNMIITPLLPTTDARANELLRDCFNAALLEIANINKNYNPNEWILDADDYMTCALNIALQIHTETLFFRATPLDALHSLLANEEFILDCLAADFSADLLKMFAFED